MSKRDKIQVAMNWAAGAAAAYFVGSAIAGAIKRKREATSGIGAAKRRIYKELSLAQQAGVDFSKKYDELTDEEIIALQQVGAETGYTETYYKSLKKAYDAISGIGANYDVRDADGNVCLTWVEDPAEQARAAQELEDVRKRTEEAEARASESRKRLKKMRRGDYFMDNWDGAKELGERMARKQAEESQLALFGVGSLTDEEKKQVLFDIWREDLDYGYTDLDFDTWRRTVGQEIMRSNDFRYIYGR